MSLLDEALAAKRRYGWRVILFGNEGKSPEICGAGWNKVQNQSEEELKDLYEKVKDRATCWGPVCGFNGLASFDFDWAWVFRLVVEKLGGERFDTLIIETPNGGYRPYFTTDTPKTDDS